MISDSETVVPGTDHRSNYPIQARVNMARILLKSVLKMSSNNKNSNHRHQPGPDPNKPVLGRKMSDENSLDETDLWKDGDIVEQFETQFSQEGFISSLSNHEQSTRYKHLKTIGSYPIKRKLKSGAESTVFLGEHLRLGRQVAIKVISLDINKTRKKALEECLREARIADRIDHPNIIRVYDLGEDSLVGFYIVMEYAEKGDLASLLKKEKTFDVVFATNVIKSVAKALVEAYKHNIVHRDIKPQNIMLTGDGKVKLADLGLAKYTNLHLDMTQTGSSFGTPYYMAPEQYEDAKHVDHRADIYALGITFYQLVTGELPYTGDTKAQVMRKKDLGNFKEPKSLALSLDLQINNIICKMMARKPEDRFQSAQELLHDLESYKPPLRGEIAVNPHRMTAIPPRKSYVRVTLAAVGLFLVYGFIYVGLKRHLGKPEEMDIHFRSLVAAAATQSQRSLDNFSPKCSTDKLAPKFSQQIERIRSEANVLLRQEAFESAFKKYQQIWQKIRSLRLLDGVCSQCVAEKANIQNLVDNLKELFPKISNTSDWEQGKSMQTRAARLLDQGEFDKALAHLQQTLELYESLLSRTFDSDHQDFLAKIEKLDTEKSTLVHQEISSNHWSETMEIITQAANAYKARNYQQATLLSGRAISTYKRANDAASKMISQSTKERQLEPDRVKPEAENPAAVTVIPPTVNWNVKVKKEEKLALPISAQMTRELPNKLIGIELLVKEGKKSFIDGEHFSLIARANTDCHVAVLCHSVGQDPVIIFPNEHNEDNFIPGAQFISIPDRVGDHNKTGFKFTVRAPFGQDVMEVIACTSEDELKGLLEGRKPSASMPFSTITRTVLEDNLRAVVVETDDLTTDDSVKDLIKWGQTTLTITTEAKE